jgi:hypothetical protein
MPLTVSRARSIDGTHARDPIRRRLRPIFVDDGKVICMTIEAAPAPAFLVGASPSKEASDVGVK